MKALAQSLREAGLEGPAREAEKLAALVGPAGAREEQLNAFARLHQMLALFRVKVTALEDLSAAELVEVPPLPSLKVEKSLLRADAGPLEYRPDAGPAGRYAYLVRAYRWLEERPPPAPEGEGFTVWGDLTIGPILGMRYEGKPDEALAAAERALRMWNVAVRRNAVRVLEKAFAPLAPLRQDHPAMELLERALGDARPVVMFEAMAVWRRLQGLSPYDLSGPFGSVPAEARLAALGGASALSITRREDILRGRTSDAAAARSFRSLPPYEWTPHEWAFYWQDQFRQSRSLYTRSSKIGAGALGAPRGDALEWMKECFAGGKPADQEDWLEFVWFAEDPLAMRLVRPLLFADKDSVRRRAMVAAGTLGDPALLPVAEKSIRAKDKDSPWAVWALGFSGDVRAFHLLWSAFEAGIKDDAVLQVLPMFGEIAAPVLDKLAADPKAATPAQLRELLLRLYPGRELEALLYAADRTGDPKVEAQLLRSFSMTKKRQEERDALERTSMLAGYRKDARGVWARDPAIPHSVETATALVQGGREIEVWMRAENSRANYPNVALKSEDSIDDWTFALLRRLREWVGDGTKDDPSRGGALRRLAFVAGESGDREVQAALAALGPAEAQRIRDMAFPPKKRGGKGN